MFLFILLVSKTFAEMFYAITMPNVLKLVSKMCNDGLTVVSKYLAKF